MKIVKEFVPKKIKADCPLPGTILNVMNT